MAHAATSEANRGRDAERPSEVPSSGWRDILIRVKDEVVDDRLSIISAGVAFYLLLAVFPALTALVSLYGLVFDPQQVTQQLSSLSGVLPSQAMDLLTGQLGELAKTNRSALGLGVAGGLALALWSSSAGVRTLIDALNVAYDEDEDRSFFRRVGIALLLTLAAILGGVAATAAVVLLPAIDDFLGLGSTLQTVIDIARWPLVALLFAFGVALLYRYGPSRDKARWRWVSWGAVVATLLWLAGSGLFSWYVSNFDSYNKSYGSLGGVVILLMWFLLSAFTVLIGAEVNSELERQTRRDTTVGDREPLGRRDAHAADTVGRST